MAFIRYRPATELDACERVDDPDNIIQIHALNPAVMREHLPASHAQTSGDCVTLGSMTGVFITRARLSVTSHLSTVSLTDSALKWNTHDAFLI